MLIGGAGWSLFDGWRLGRLAPATAIDRVYFRLYWYGQRLAVPLWNGDTPYEFSRALMADVEALARGKRWQTLLEPAAQEVQWLTNLYVQTAYSDHPPKPAEQQQAIRIWQRLQGRLWLAWLSTQRLKR